MNITHKWQKEFTESLEGMTPTHMLHYYSVLALGYKNASLTEVANNQWKVKYLAYILSPLLEKNKAPYDVGKAEGYREGYQEGYDYWLNSKRFEAQIDATKVHTNETL